MDTQRNPRTGHFVSTNCPDPNCGGVLVEDRDRFGDKILRCDGLVDPGQGRPLEACTYQVD